MKTRRIAAALLSLAFLASCAELRRADDARKDVKVATTQVQAAQKVNAEVQANPASTDQQKADAAKALTDATALLTAKTQALQDALAKADAAAKTGTDVGGIVSSAIPPPYNMFFALAVGLAGGLYRARVHKSSADALQSAGTAVVQSIEALKAAGKLNTDDPTVAAILNAVQGAAGKVLVDTVQGKSS